MVVDNGGDDEKREAGVFEGVMQGEGEEREGSSVGREGGEG